MSQNVETIYRVHKPSGGAFLEIGDYSHAPGVLELRSTDKTSEEWFGDISLTLQPEFAIDLGNALVSAGYNKLAQLKTGNC